MKKFLYLFTKGKRSQENFYNLYDGSLSNEMDNHFGETNIFKCRAFDSNGYDTSEIGYGILLDSKVEGIINSQECIARSLSNYHTITSTAKDLLDVLPKNDPPFKSTCLDSIDSRVKMEEEDKCKSEEKVRKNLCLINISNSKYFHIGSQKTINVNDSDHCVSKTAQSCQVPHSFKNCSAFYLKVNFQNLLDSEERLAEKYIVLISQNVDDKWKEFLNYLGLEKLVLDTLEVRNNHNRIFSVYDALHKYITQFPNTSLGFVVYALSQIHQVVVIEKLVQELKL